MLCLSKEMGEGGGSGALNAEFDFPTAPAWLAHNSNVLPVVSNTSKIIEPYNKHMGTPL